MKDLFLLIGEAIYRGSNSIEELELEIEMPKSFDEEMGWVSTSSLSSEFEDFTNFEDKEEVNKALLVAEYALSILIDWNFEYIEYDDSLPESLKHLADDDGYLYIFSLASYCKSLVI